MGKGNFLLTFTLYLFFIGNAFAKPLVSANVSQKSIRPDDIVQLELIIVEETDGFSEMGENNSLDFKSPLKDFDVLPGGSRQKNIDASAPKIRQVLKLQYALRPKKTGKLTIPGLVYSYQESGKTEKVFTQPITISVKALPKKSGFFPYFLIIFGLLIGSFIGFFIFRKKIKSQKVPQISQVSVEITEGEIPVSETSDSQPSHLSGKTMDEKIEYLKEYVREKVATHLDMILENKTTDEVLNALFYQSVFTENEKKWISDVLKQCDASRFQPIPMTEAEFDQLFKQMDQIFKISSN